MRKARNIKKQASLAGRRAHAQLAVNELFDPIVKKFLSDSSVTQSKMFGSPGLKVGGKVFAMLVKGELVVKLPKERVESLVESGAGTYFDPGHGRLMKEWVAVRPGSGDWLSLAREAKNFVAQGG